TGLEIVEAEHHAFAAFERSRPRDGGARAHRPRRELRVPAAEPRNHDTLAGRGAILKNHRRALAVAIHLWRDVHRLGLRILGDRYHEFAAFVIRAKPRADAELHTRIGRHGPTGVAGQLRIGDESRATHLRV